MVSGVLVPLVMLACLEGGLRLGGYGYPTGFFLHREASGQRVITENRKFGWRFFGPALARTPRPMMIPEAKAPGTCRIFIFGESAAYGDPRPEFGLPRVLEVLLRERFPETRFEVINAAMTGINSHVVLLTARDCARQDGDIWVIYMGNNEVVGPFGSGTVFGQQAPSLPLIRASLALKATRIGELLDNILRRAASSRTKASQWGMALFLGRQVRQDDPGMPAVYAHFARNLADMLKLGRAHGAKIIVSTVVSNLKDCPPFASQHRPGLSERELKRWDELYAEASQAEQAGKTAEALEGFSHAAAIDDQFAEVQFRWGRCCLMLGQGDEARSHFVKARDYDALFQDFARIAASTRSYAPQPRGGNTRALCWPIASRFWRTKARTDCRVTSFCSSTSTLISRATTVWLEPSPTRWLDFCPNQSSAKPVLSGNGRRFLNAGAGLRGRIGTVTKR